MLSADHYMSVKSNSDEFLADDEEEEEFDDYDSDTRFLEVCMEGDVEDLVQLFEEISRNQELLGPEDLNCADNSGRTAVSYLCGNGMIEMLEVLEDVPELDYNIPDTEGNTPLHYAAQAGHVEVVSFLLTKVRTIQVDPINHQGFTPLMKAALQGRIKCSKLLLFSGASPVRRDFGRRFTASQWARFCGRSLCAESIEKFVRTAVPGGAALISDSSGGSMTSLGQKSKTRSRLRSRSALGSKSASWLTRTIRKAFSSGPEAENDLEDSPRPCKTSFKFGRSGRSSKKRKSHGKVIIPQVEVTLTTTLSVSEVEEDVMEAAEVVNPPSGTSHKKFFLGKKW